MSMLSPAPLLCKLRCLDYCEHLSNVACELQCTAVGTLALRSQMVDEA